VPKGTGRFFIFMNSFSPTTEIAPQAYSQVTVVKDAYDSFTIPAIVVTGTIGIVAEYAVVAGPFAIRPLATTPTVPFTVRCSGTRYFIGGPNQPNALALPYEGQTIPEDAIFEYWATGATPISVPSLDVPISTRAGQTITVTLTVPVRKSYPISYPITNA
jgi:hypothetical protein